LTKAIEVRKEQRKTGYSPAYEIATLYADLGQKNEALKWLDTAYQERDMRLEFLKTDFLFDPCDPIHDSLSWCGRWGCRKLRDIFLYKAAHSTRVAIVACFPLILILGPIADTEALPL
jgi:hypothetical protein